MLSWKRRPQWRGRPVPYVARYPSSLRMTARFENPRFEKRLSPFTGREAWVLEIDGVERDDFGWLWFPDDSYVEDRNARPEFGEVHSIRQRACMDELRCQVCGESAVSTGAITTWIIPDIDFRNGERRGRILTSHAPVCTDCIDVSLTQCPHLRAHKGKGHVLAIPAATVRPYGVLGDVYDLQGERTDTGIIPPFAADEAAARTIAKQRVVALKGWREL